MLCKNPIDLSGKLVGCGQCMPCRINKKREVTARIILEYMMHEYSLFITLTYNDDSVPINHEGDQTLRPEDVKDWIRRFKRAHKHIGPVRYFVVGEYGEKTERAHYHAILFGVSPHCEKMVHETWNQISVKIGQRWRIIDYDRGFTMCGIMNPDRAAYIAGYTTKKMTSIGHRDLRARWPEFSRWSKGNKILGAIGDSATGWLASSMRGNRGQRLLARHGDVWREVRINGHVYPLSRYMRKRLRRALNVPEDPQERLNAFGHIDLDTGEIIAPEPLPAYYGPWHDADTFLTPVRRRAEKEEKTLSLPEAIKRAEKVERRYSKTSPTTKEV